jgi:hypothetical protein
MRWLVMPALLVACALAWAQKTPYTPSTPEVGASAPLVKPRSRVVPDPRAVLRKASASDELRVLVKAQTEVIRDLSSRLDDMDRRLHQLEMKER